MLHVAIGWVKLVDASVSAWASKAAANERTRPVATAMLLPLMKKAGAHTALSAYTQKTNREVLRPNGDGAKPRSPKAPTLEPLMGPQIHHLSLYVSRPVPKNKLTTNGT